jgi:hypothetical protein
VVPHKSPDFGDFLSHLTVSLLDQRFSPAICGRKCPVGRQMECKNGLHLPPLPALTEPKKLP